MQEKIEALRNIPVTPRSLFIDGGWSEAADGAVLEVVSPIDDTPAQRAGVLANDFIVEINGTSVKGISLDEAVGMMKGKVGTKIKITVIREGAAEPLYFDLTRDVIAQRVVRYTMEGDVAVLRLARFTEQAFPGIQKAIRDIYEERKGTAPKGIILDLRNNPGGLVDQAVYVSDAFLKQGAVVLTRGRNEEEATRYDARPDDLDAKLAAVPLIVLINGGSASAAEIVAGALQDHKRATLIGTRSFGKGSVQSIINLGPDGGIRLTTARYYTPSNRSIQAAGITPDITVKENVPAEFAGRDEILGASNRDFKALAEALDQVARQGQVVVLGSETAIKAANDERGGFLKVTKVL